MHIEHPVESLFYVCRIIDIKCCENRETIFLDEVCEKIVYLMK